MFCYRLLHGFYSHSSAGRSSSSNARPHPSAGEVPAGWLDQPEKADQKDVDARWMLKNAERHYGYKNRVKVDSRSRLVEDFTVIAASVHDSQVLGKLIAEGPR